MNIPRTLTSPLKGSHRGAALAAVVLALALPGAASAQSDDFDDGNDNGWTHYNVLEPFGWIGTFSFPNGGYRIQTTYLTGQAANPGRDGSYRTDVTYTDFYVAVDIVNWNDSLKQSFGLLARVGSVSLGTSRGYAFTWDRGTPPGGGDMDLSRIDNETPTQFEAEASGLRLEAGKQYRFVLIGKGSRFEGRVYELPNVMTPILTLTGNDGAYPSGYCGLVVFDNDQGRSQTDATFDNYFASIEEPPRLTIERWPFQELMVGWPEGVTGYRLQASPTLAPGNWTDLTTSDLGNGYQGVLEDYSAGTKYYRLIKP